MRRLLPLALLVAAGAGCSSFGPSPAATVDGTEISSDSIVEELELLRDDERARAFVFGPQFDTALLLGEGTATFSTTAAADRLNERVFLEAFRQRAERDGIEVTGEDREQASQGADVGGLPEDFVERRVGGLSAFLAVTRAAISDAGLDDPEAFFEAEPEVFDTLCLSHILIRTRGGQPPEAALAIAEGLAGQLADGADFAELASGTSEDPGSGAQGGDLGCGGADRFVEPFAEAAVALEEGDVSEPVQTEFGYHLILLREREGADFSDEAVQQRIGQQLGARTDELQQALLEEVASEADVHVDPRFGRWERDDAEGRLGVLPPEGPVPQGTEGLEFEL